MQPHRRSEEAQESICTVVDCRAARRGTFTLLSASRPRRRFRRAASSTFLVLSPRPCACSFPPSALCGLSSTPRHAGPSLCIRPRVAHTPARSAAACRCGTAHADTRCTLPRALPRHGGAPLRAASAACVAELERHTRHAARSTAALTLRPALSPPKSPSPAQRCSSAPASSAGGAGVLAQPLDGRIPDAFHAGGASVEGTAPHLGILRRRHWPLPRCAPRYRLTPQPRAAVAAHGWLGLLAGHGG